MDDANSNIDSKIIAIRILIVDDNEISIMVLNEMLKSYNVAVDMAMNGKEAINCANKNKYNLIFMDYMMPEMDGLETTSYIRKSGINSGTPIIIMSGSVDDDDVKRYKENGMDDYMAKPTDAREIQRLLYKWIPDMEVINDNRKNFSIPGIDVAMGLDNFGDNTLYYFDILRMFCRNSADKIKDISDYLNKRNYNGYTVEVHGLKGEAAIIGATELALMAKELEVAGKAVQGIIKTDIPVEKNLEFIEEETPNLIELYLALITDIKKTVGESPADEVEPDKNEGSETVVHIDNEIIEKAKRYINHAIESIGNGDTELAIEWLTEVTENILKV